MYFNSKQLRPMSLDEIHRAAPAVFAEQRASRTSEKYLFIQPRNIVEELMKEGWAVVSAVQTASRSHESKETSKHALMLARRDAINTQFDVGDTLPLIKIDNSHNGLSSFKLMSALFRKVCANGMTVPDGYVSSPTIRHTQAMAGDVVEASYKLINEFPQLMEKIGALKSVTLNADEQRILARSAANIIFEPEQILLNDNLRRPIHEQLLISRRYEDRKDDLWTIANVIQENAIRGNVKILSENGTSKKTKAVKSIDRDSRINQELMTLAAAMAELKGVKVSDKIVA
jgi:hypothetical protein